MKFPVSLVIFVCGSLVAALRNLHLVIEPTLYAEEGSTYFVNALQIGGWESLLARDLAYYHGLAKLGAAAGAEWLPLRLAAWPMVVLGATVLATLLAMVSTCRAELLSPWWARAFLTFTIVGSPLASEGWLSALHGMYLGPLIGILVLLELEARPRLGNTSRGRRLLTGWACLVAALSGPLGVVLAPLFAWVAWRQRSRASIQCALLIAVALAFHLIWYASGLVEGSSDSGRREGAGGLWALPLQFVLGSIILPLYGDHYWPIQAGGQSLWTTANLAPISIGAVLLVGALAWSNARGPSAARILVMALAIVGLVSARFQLGLSERYSYASFVIVGALACSLVAQRRCAWVGGIAMLVMSAHCFHAVVADETMAWKHPAWSSEVDEWSAGNRVVIQTRPRLFSVIIPSPRGASGGGGSAVDPVQETLGDYRIAQLGSGWTEDPELPMGSLRLVLDEDSGMLAATVSEIGRPGTLTLIGVHGVGYPRVTFEAHPQSLNYVEWGMRPSYEHLWTKQIAGADASFSLAGLCAKLEPGDRATIQAAFVGRWLTLTEAFVIERRL